jgi:hypothetical protein
MSVVSQSPEIEILRRRGTGPHPSGAVVIRVLIGALI